MRQSFLGLPAFQPQLGGARRFRRCDSCGHGYSAGAGLCAHRWHPTGAGLYTVLLPLLAFAVFGSSRHLIVAADSARLSSFLVRCLGWRRPPASSIWRWSGMVALLTAGFLLLARIFRLGFLADFLSRTVLVGFLTGVGFQVGMASWVTCSVSRSARTARSFKRGKSYRVCHGPIFRHLRYPHSWRAASCSGNGPPHDCLFRYSRSRNNCGELCVPTR